MASYQVQDPTGGMHVIEGPEGASPDEVLSQAQSLIPKPGQIESFARGAANNFPLAPQAIAGGEALTGLGDEGGYTKNLSDWNQKAATAKAAHPVTYGAGAMTGAVAPLLIPGVGEALEASPIAGNALYGGLNAISNKDLTKDAAGTVKEAALGSGIGGATAGLLGKVFPKAATFEAQAQNKGLQSTGIGQKFLGEMKPEELAASKNFVMDNDLVGVNKEEVLQKALQKQKELGESLSNIGKSVESAGVKADYEDWNGAIKKLSDKLAGTSDTEYKTIKDLAPRYSEAMDDITNALSKDPSWASIQKLKQKFGEVAFDNMGEVKDKPAADTYFTLRDMLTNLTKKAQENPDLPNEYKQALAGYHTIDPVIEGLQKAVGAERAGTGGHAAGHGFLPRLIRSLPGQNNPGTNLATAGLATMISPHLGPLMALPTLTNPAIQSKAFSAAARQLPGIKQGASQELTDFLESKFGRKQ